MNASLKIFWVLCFLFLNASAVFCEKKKNAAEDSLYSFEGLIFPGAGAVLSSLGSGVVDYLPWNEGDTVKKGDILVGLRAEKDSLNIVLAERELEKSKIHKSGEVEKQIALRLKQIGYEEKFIRAPFSGTLVKVMAKKHEYYGAGSQMVELADLKSLRTEIHVNQAQLKRLLKGKPDIAVRRGDQKIPGRLLAHSPVAEPGVELFLVKVGFDNPYHWRPGTGVQVRF